MRSFVTLAASLMAAAFVVFGATSAIAGPSVGSLVPCDINDDETKDLAYKGVPGTGEADFDKTTIIEAGAVPANGTGTFATGGETWQLQTCGQFGSAGLVTKGVLGGATNFIRTQTLNAAGDSVVSTTFSGLGGGDWELAGTADLDGDGFQELVFQGVTGTGGQPFAKVDFIVGNNAPTTIFLQTADGTFRYAGKGDTDDDGDEDLFWQNTDGENFRIDLVDGTNAVVSDVKPSGGFDIALIADVTGDDKADMVLQGATTAKLQELDGSTYGREYFRANGGGALDPILAGDTDNNGVHDLVYINTGDLSSSRVDTMADATGGGSIGFIASGFINTGNFVPQAMGDFDGDLKADIAGQAPGGTRLYIMDGITATTGNFTNTNANYQVVQE